MKKVIIGGTFDFLHKGHKALLKRAFELGDVTVGVTSDSMAEASRNRDVGGFSERKAELEWFIKNEIGKEAEIVEINDKFGPSVEKDFDYIVTSPETFKTALLINEERKKVGKSVLKIEKIDYVLADDGKPISSTRIYNGEIDRDGKVIK